MAEDFDPEWEYRVDNVEVAEAVYGHHPVHRVYDLLEADEWSARERGTLVGFRFGRGNPDYPRLHLAPERYRRPPGRPREKPEVIAPLRRKGVHGMTDERLFIALWQAGVKMELIAQVFGISLNTTKSQRHRLKLPARPIGNHNHKKRGTVDNLLSLPDALHMLKSGWKFGEIVPFLAHGEDLPRLKHFFVYGYLDGEVPSNYSSPTITDSLLPLPSQSPSPPPTPTNNQSGIDTVLEDMPVLKIPKIKPIPPQEPHRPSVPPAQQQGYTGDICDHCGSLTMLRAGKCLTCATCGESGGCG